MTLGNMRQNGARGFAVTCLHCAYHYVVNVDRWPDDLSRPLLRPADAVQPLRHYGRSELDRATRQRARWEAAFVMARIPMTPKNSIAA